jgi:diguanylate cyclase (GGDEF)-like protein
MQLNDYIIRQPKINISVFVLILVALIGVADYLTGAEISFSIFYLFPVGLAAWFIDRWFSVVVSVIGAAIWWAADLIARTSYANPVIHFWNMTASLCVFLVFSYLLSALKTSLHKEHLLSQTDYLTGLLNRRGFTEIANVEIKRMSRFGHPFTIGYIDLDNFKMVNDRLGHNAGDLLLHAVATTMLITARETDIIARIGGDEFAVLLPETGFQPSQVLFEKLQAHLLTIMEKKNWPVTFSMGVVTFVEPPDSVEDMLNRVDKIMYAVKNSGKGMIKHEIFGGKSA